MESLLKKKFYFIFTMALFLFTNILFAGETNFGGFSELSFKASDSKSSNSNTFIQGGIDLYITKTVGPKTNILAEIVFEISEENEAILDPERIWIQHELSTWFKIKAGRVHTALGYWNEKYHHGSWLQTSVSRPIIFNFEDDGGIFPIHTIGVELRGSGEVGPGIFEYVVDIGNGRGVSADPPQSGKDADTDKALRSLVKYKMGNLTFGYVFATDKVASSTDFDANSDGVAGDTRNSFTEVISGGNLVWDDGKSHFILEAFNIKHKYSSKLTPTTIEADTSITAYYLQFSHKMKKFTPYIRYGEIKGDSKNYDHYLNFAADLEKNKATVGIRQDLTFTSAVKYEYSLEKISVADPVTSYIVNWSYAW